MGIPREIQFPAPSNGLQIEFACEFMIERKVADVNVRIEGWRLGSARAFENKVGAPFDRETIRMNPRDVGEIEIAANEIEAKSAGGGIVGGASGNDGIVVQEMDVIESELVLDDMEGGIELLNRSRHRPRHW